jgi:hypothetical protein
MSLIKKAKRSEAYLKMAVSGASGSGKTYSSLLLAKGFMGSFDEVVVIDTENGSANLYEDLGCYSVLPFEAPFEPQRYVKAIDYCVAQGFKFIILDSGTHEWEECLKIHAKLGGQWKDWNTVTPMHQAFVNSILQSKAHIICTLRSKQETAMVEKNGKKQVEKFGLKEIQREGFEYEVSLSLSINMDHMAVASKDRTGLFSDPIPFKITEETGRLIKNWNMNQKQ